MPYKTVDIAEKDFVSELNKQEKLGWEAVQYLEKFNADINGVFWKILFWKK